jgi:DNA-binding NtrC family response regulator
MTENLQGKKLIILEDDATNVFLLKALLENTQTDAVYCTTVDEFLDVYRGDKDIVLLDIRVPGDKDGIDLLKEVKKRDPNQPVIMQSAFTDRADECKKLGADAFIEKPDVFHSLLPTIRRLLNKLKNKNGGI